MTFLVQVQLTWATWLYNGNMSISVRVRMPALVWRIWSKVDCHCCWSFAGLSCLAWIWSCRLAFALMHPFLYLRREIDESSYDRNITLSMFDYICDLQKLCLEFVSFNFRCLTNGIQWISFNWYCLNCVA